tara:strand:- start:233 stop:397 length:165 start_codon:yes stop_codon:yes gene_type:complete
MKSSLPIFPNEKCSNNEFKLKKFACSFAVEEYIKKSGIFTIVRARHMIEKVFMI